MKLQGCLKLHDNKSTKCQNLDGNLYEGKKKDCKLEIHFQCKKLEKSKNYSKEVEADR